MIKKALLLDDFIVLVFDDELDHVCVYMSSLSKSKELSG